MELISTNENMVAIIIGLVLVIAIIIISKLKRNEIKRLYGEEALDSVSSNNKEKIDVNKKKDKDKDIDINIDIDKDKDLSMQKTCHVKINEIQKEEFLNAFSDELYRLVDIDMSEVIDMFKKNINVELKCNIKVPVIKDILEDDGEFEDKIKQIFYVFELLDYKYLHADDFLPEDKIDEEKSSKMGTIGKVAKDGQEIILESKTEINTWKNYVSIVFMLPDIMNVKNNGTYKIASIVIDKENRTSMMLYEVLKDINIEEKKLFEIIYNNILNIYDTKLESYNYMMKDTTKENEEKLKDETLKEYLLKNKDKAIEQIGFNYDLCEYSLDNSGTIYIYLDEFEIETMFDAKATSEDEQPCIKMAINR